MKKVKLFTDNDLDGVGCIVATNTIYGIKNVSYETCSYSNVNEVINNYFDTMKKDEVSKIIISDISVNEEVAERIQELVEGGLNIKLYDHHKTAEWLNQYGWAKVIVEQNGELESGTSLLYYSESDDNIKYKINSMMFFVEAVTLYDTWQWKVKGKTFPKQLHDILNIIGIEDFVRYYSNLSGNLDKSTLLPEKFEMLLKYKRIEIDKFLKDRLSKVKVKNNCAYVFCSSFGNISELGAKILENQDIKIAFIVYEGGVSLRSQPDIDCSSIALMHGGGGHKNACGFKTDKWHEWI